MNSPTLSSVELFVGIGSSVCSTQFSCNFFNYTFLLFVYEQVRLPHHFDQFVRIFAIHSNRICKFRIETVMLATHVVSQHMCVLVCGIFISANLQRSIGLLLE